MKSFFLPLKRILYTLIHGKKDLQKQEIIPVDEWKPEILEGTLEGTLDKEQTKKFKKSKKWYSKENCKCYECLTNESKDCFANCLPASGFEYTAMPCKSCEFRSWCYTKYE